ncbi:MAG: hypothetical protein AAF658_19900, partial [Myxococcota bacterium]
MLQFIEQWKSRRQTRRTLDAHLDALAQSRYANHRCTVQYGLLRVYVARTDTGFALRLPADFAFDPHLEERQTVEAKLADQGFQLAAGVSGLEWSKITRDAPTQVQDLLVRTFEFSRDIVYSVALEPERSADNPELRTAMRTLADERSMDARHSVYRKLLDATLLLTVKRESEHVAPFSVNEDLPGGTWL